MFKQVALATIVLTVMIAIAMPRSSAAASIGAVVNATKLAGHQGEPTIAVNPLNPSQMFMASVYVDAIGNGGGTGGGLPVASSSDGGATWTQYTIGTGTAGDGFAPACCDPVAAWDSYGNLFLVYLGKLGPGYQPVELLRSSTGTAGSWTLLGDLETVASNDQPTVAVGPGSVWVTWNQGNAIVARGAAVTGLGVVGPFSQAQVATGSDVVAGEFGDIAVGPSGQVVVTYQDDTTIYSNVDADGLGPGGFGAQTIISSTGVARFYSIPAQSHRLIDAETSLKYDRSGGSHNGRLYAAYADTGAGGASDTDIMLRYSDDDGATWTSPVRANDDSTTNSQFLPHLAIDETTGVLGITWYDARNVATNDAAQVFGTFSTDGGASVLPSLQITTGISKMTTATGVPVNPFQFGDYRWSAFESGTLYVAWTDNSNSTGDNPNGTGSLADIYVNAVAFAPVAPKADLRVAMVADATSYKPNATVTYHLTVTNDGPSSASSVVLTDHLPDIKQAIYLSATDGCTLSAPATLTCALGDIAPGGGVSFDVLIRVKGSRGLITNSASVTSATADPNAANDSASVTVAVAGKP